jgi:pimeloyl-ACP methyl ester carboxylesterase
MRTPSAPPPGVPVVVLSGVGLTAGVAARLLDALSAAHRVISIGAADGDGHGSPRDDAGMDARVARAIAALDAGGAEDAHVVGLSFGGMVAQEIAIRHPARVRSLVLGATSAGGELCVPPAPPVSEFLRRLHELPAEEGLWGSVPYLYAPRTRQRHAGRIGEDLARRASEPLHPGAFRAQQAAARAHDAAARLERITAPTLVIHGEEDRVLPPENGRRLAASIAGARLLTLRHAAHAFPTDQPEIARELVSFVRAQSRPRPEPAGRRNARAARA